MAGVGIDTSPGGWGGQTAGQCKEQGVSVCLCMQALVLSVHAFMYFSLVVVKHEALYVPPTNKPLRR